MYMVHIFYCIYNFSSSLYTRTSLGVSTIFETYANYLLLINNNYLTHSQLRVLYKLIFNTMFKVNINKK